MFVTNPLSFDKLFRFTVFGKLTFYINKIKVKFTNMKLVLFIFQNSKCYLNLVRKIN